MNELKQPQARRTLPITLAVTFLGFLDTHLLIPVMALYAFELGASVVIVGLIIGLYSVTNTPANILFGRLIDRVGYKVPLIAGLLGDALKVKVTAPPVEGRANKAVKKLVAEQLGIAPSQVDIIAGERSREKLLRISGISRAEMEKALGITLPPA